MLVSQESAIPDRKEGSVAKENGCGGNNSIVLSLYPDSLYEDKSTKSSVSQKSFSDANDSPEYSAKSAYLGLGQDMVISSSEVELQPTNVTSDDECVHQDITDTKQSSGLKGERQGNNLKQSNQSKQDAERKINEMILSSPYSTVASSGKKPGLFQKKIRQLNTLGVFRTNRNPTIKVEPYGDLSGLHTSQDGGDVRSSESGNLQRKPPSIDDESNANPNGNASSGNENPIGLKTDSNREASLKSRSSVVIFNAPTDYSHVKSRLFVPNTNSVNESSPANSPTPKRRITTDDDKDNKNGSNKQEQEGKENHSKSRSSVVIFNAPSDYSHVKSRLLGPTPNANNTPTPNRRKKTDSEEEVNNNEIVGNEQRQGGE